MLFRGVEVPMIGPDITKRTLELYYEWLDDEWMNE